MFGSLADGGFHERPDVDVALIGMPPKVAGDLEAEVFRLLEDEGFEPDVVSERFLSASLRERVLRHGRSVDALA